MVPCMRAHNDLRNTVWNEDGSQPTRKRVLVHMRVKEHPFAQDCRSVPDKNQSFVRVVAPARIVMAQRH